MSVDDEIVRALPKERRGQIAEERRRLVRSVLVGGAVACAALAGLLPRQIAGAAPRLRPPGALDENAFLAACIKCGQCVQVCPVQAIKLADLDEGISIGTPFIDARAQACDFSCDATQCILACPTGALSHAIDKKEQVKMGVARLARPDACLARQGKGFKGVARGEAHRGLLRYPEIDRWSRWQAMATISTFATCVSANARSKARSSSNRLWVMPTIAGARRLSRHPVSAAGCAK